MILFTEPRGCCFNVAFYHCERGISRPDLWSATGCRGSCLSWQPSQRPRRVRELLRGSECSWRAASGVHVGEKGNLKMFPRLLSEDGK